MSHKILTFVAIMVINVSAYAAHIVTDTRNGDTLIKRTHTYANSAGDLRIDEQGFNASASAGASAGTGKVTTQYSPGKINDSMLYQSKGQAIVSLEGRICRRMTADSAPPPGMPTGSSMSDMNKQMADAMSQANKAMEDAMKQARQQGMTPEQERLMKQYTQPFMDTPTAKKSEVSVEKLNDKIKVGDFSGTGYLITDERGEQHRVWLTPASKIPGGEDVRKGMNNMFGVFTGFAEKIGGAGLMDRGMFSVFMSDEFANMYPIRTEDVSSGEITEIVEADARGPSVEFYPECEERDMFGQ